MEEIINVYTSTGSLKETAKISGIGWQKVRKILITADIYESELSLEINKLHLDGLSINDISKKLKLSRSTVHSYLPYVKCEYNKQNLTDNAVRIRKYRAKEANSENKRD